jgi:uncharacterized delta-60 repeat protein
MRKTGVVLMAVALAACGGRKMTVELPVNAVHVPIGGEQQLTLRLHNAPSTALPQLTSDAPAGISLFPNVLASAEGDQLISVSAAAGTAAGINHTLLSVTAGTEVATVPLDIEVIDAQAFTLTLDPPTVVVRQGHSSTAMFSVKNAAMHSASGPVVVTVEGTMPTGLHVTGSTVTLSGDSAASGSLSVAADPQVTAQTTMLSLVATHGSLSAKLDFQVMVLDATSPDFTLSAPTTLALRTGGQSTLAVHVASQMGFSDMVNLTAVNPPAGIGVSSGVATVNAPAMLSVTADGTVAAGNLQLTLTGNAGPLVHQVKVTLHITNSGTVDAMFGTMGLAALSSIGGQFNGLAVANDGSIIGVGNSNNGAVAVRLTPDGVLDTTFGTGGIAMVNIPGDQAAGENVLALDDGSVLMTAYSYGSSTGQYAETVAKLKPDGSLDTTWGTQGFYTDNNNAYPLGLLLLSNGGVLLSITRVDQTTYSDIGVFTRLTAAGLLDTTFGNAGTLTYPTNTYAMAADELVDGTLVVLTGTFTQNYDENTPTVSWLTATGQPATTFGTNGSTVLDTGTVTQMGYRLHARSDASIVVTVVGDTDTSFNNPKTFVFQLTPQGALDTTFGPDGTGRASFAGMGVAATLTPDGSALVAGCSGSQSQGNASPMVVRVTPAGTLDATFHDANSSGVAVSGVALGCAVGVAVQPSGKIVVGGNLGGSSSSSSTGWFLSRLMP